MTNINIVSRAALSANMTPEKTLIYLFQICFTLIPLYSLRH